MAEQENPQADAWDQEGGAGLEGASPPGEPSAESEVERLRADLEEAGDRVLRAQAELENYRKRARRELEDERRYCSLPLLRDLLPVADNIERAIAAAEKASEAGSLLEGIRLVAQTLHSTFTRYGCTRIDALHQPFDPAVHEAISQQPSREFPPGTVLMVVQVGYMLHERLLRPAQVIVSTQPDGAAR